MEINNILRKLDLNMVAPVYQNAYAGRALYQVKSKSTELAYALKVYDLELNPERQISAEVTVLNRFPFGLVPHVHAFHKHEGHAYVLVDWIEGKPLNQLYQQPATDKYQTVERLKLVIAAGWRLNNIHRARLYHRDIKPDNLIVAGNPQRPDVFIIDFGNSAIPRGWEEGSLNYRAPEQYLLRNERITEQTDVFGLAQTLWFLLAGEPAELELNTQMNGWDNPEYPMLAPDAPKASLLFKALQLGTAFYPKDRPTLQQFLRQLADVSRG